MNVESLKDLSDANTSGIIDGLIAHLQLSPQQVVDIRHAMQARGTSFIETAVSLNLVSPEQVDALVTKVLELRQSKPGVIESALRKVLRRSPITATQEPDETCTLSDKLTIAHNPYSERSEKFRGLRTELTLRLGTTSKASMLAIISAAHGEGRTQLAAELAIAFAQLDRRTLLVDADLRKPGIFKLFQCQNNVGLSQAIGDNSRPYIFGVANLPQLHILNTGPTPSNPIEMLSTKRFEQLVNSWRNVYDFVVFDTPPVAAYADALTVATLVRRVLLTTRANTSSFKDAKEMLRRLSIARSEILGSVVNHF